MTKEEIIDKIIEICNKLAEEVDTLSRYDTVSHLSQSKIQWQGGIFGAIREAKENKRLVKLLNEPIVGELSYYRYAFHLIDTAEKLSALIAEYQKLADKESDDYFAPVELAIDSTYKAINCWYNLSPDMANAPLTIGDEKDVALAPTVNAFVKEEFAKIEVPEKYNDLLKSKSSDSNSGCFGTLLLLLSLGASSIFLLAAIIL